jgi:hypothetical protein
VKQGGLREVRALSRVNREAANEIRTESVELRADAGSIIEESRELRRESDATRAASAR